MPVRPAAASSLFSRILFLYLSPTLLYYLVYQVTSWKVLPLLSATSSSALASATSFLFLLLFLIPDYLEYGPAMQPKEFLFVAVPELHYLAWHLFEIIYEPPKWFLYPIVILSYPLTHVFMYNQFITLGLSPTELGYFAVVSAKLREVIFGFWRSPGPRRQDGRFTDGRS